MKFAILSLVAAGALAISAGTASAQHYHNGHYHGGYNRGGFHPVTPHLDYHRGHYHYHDGFYRSPPLVPAYPSYGYGRPSFGLTIGVGNVYPSYGGGFYNPRPYYGGYGYPRW